MQLEISEELYGYTFGTESILDLNRKYPYGVKFLNDPIVYIFDIDSFCIYRKDSNDADIIERPVVFPAISQIEIMKEYINRLNSAKIKQQFSNLNDKEFSEEFWNCFDDGSERLIDFRSFEEYYRYSRIIDWCNENNIAYFIKDKNIKKALDYKCKFRI